VEDLGLNEYQNQTAYLILSIGADPFTSDEVVSVLKSDALLASRQYTTASGLLQPLPNNQWMLEVSFWFAISLAGLQQAIVEYATGPSANHLLKGNTVPLNKIGDPSSPVTNAICNNQKIKSIGEYQNFSVLGLCCIIIIGGTIMLVSLYVESLIELAQRKMDRGWEGRTRWMADSNFQVSENDV
jgi:hypothetical protein